MDKVDENLSNPLPSNKDTVDSLVKDLEHSCEIKSNDNETQEQLLPDESNQIDEEKLKKNQDDYIDEDLLKDQEISLTDEEKIKLKSEAAELKKQGNEQYKNGEFREAVLTYTLALRTCPFSLNKDRAVLYANRGAAKLSMQLKESAIDDCTKAIELDADYVKALMRRAQLYETTDKLDEAFADYKRVLELDSANKEAIMASMRLPPLINERNENLKAEMLGKLKDLGNMVLKPFGLSTNNFNMVPNESGGYSINFKQ